MTRDTLLITVICIGVAILSVMAFDYGFKDTMTACERVHSRAVCLHILNQ